VTLARRPILLIGPLAVLVVIMALATNVLPLRQIVSQRQDIAAAEQALAELTASNDALEAHVEALQTPTEVERIAREDLGYVRPGEEAFVVIDPTPDDAPTATAEPAAEALAGADDLGGDSGGWWSQVWDYVTGRDLSGR